MQIGTSASFAIRQEALMPVPSSMIATAPSATARRTFATAVRAERPESYRLILKRTLPGLVSSPFAASSAPFAIVSPTYGVFENGALTATRSVLPEPLESPPHPEARLQTARIAATRLKVRKAISAGARDRPPARPRPRRPRLPTPRRFGDPPRGPSPRPRRGGRTGDCARLRGEPGRSAATRPGRWRGARARPEPRRPQARRAGGHEARWPEPPRA